MEDASLIRDLEELKAALLRIETKLDSRVEKVDERLRMLEQRMAQVWVLGALGVLVFAPLISLVIRKLGV